MESQSCPPARAGRTRVALLAADTISGTARARVAPRASERWSANRWRTFRLLPRSASMSRRRRNALVHACRTRSPRARPKTRPRATAGRSAASASLFLEVVASHDDLRCLVDDLLRLHGFPARPQLFVEQRRRCQAALGAVQLDQ